MKEKRELGLEGLVRSLAFDVEGELKFFYWLVWVRVFWSRVVLGLFGGVGRFIFRIMIRCIFVLLSFEKIL